MHIVRLVRTFFQNPALHKKPEGTGRVSPGSPKRTPDFLWSLLALASFMRLSLMKAAHADVGHAPWQEIRTPGLKTMGGAHRFPRIDKRARPRTSS
jgi:hypothetical protein